MAKRISQSSINWAALAERVPAEQKSNLAAFKVKSDGYLRRVLASPPEPPKINWANYKQVVPIPGMVDNFQKQYEALKIPYPSDTMTAKVEAQWGEIKKAIESFVQESNKNIAKYQQQIDELNALLPYNQMTLEDFKDAHPELAIDPINKPTFWPHTPEEQPDYVDPEKPAQSGH
ncbi:ATP synthase subunit d, mitochondrial [Danaus plexippus]|uniref:ATP synthase subunit d, mitochondrial n=1 Tax=Danaus plexippus plexippus TaxID=278856 RepID=A0A212FDT8_DANPL|nr:ATP synthase subunit d, mitochondrial [Danaus plexippus]OWR51902.1 H+ transporting ATP synthase subunit d [Danaus plexippus plexippus]